MLPFLKAKPQQTGVIVQARKPDEGKEKPAEDQGLMACAQDLISAIETKDAKAVASALRAAHEICEGGESEDSEEPSPHTYDAQNIKE